MFKTKQMARWSVLLLVLVFLSTSIIPGLSVNSYAESQAELVTIDANSSPYGAGSWSSNAECPSFFSFSGGWWSDNWNWMYDNSSNVGDYAEFRFTGTSIALYMSRVPWGCIVNIHLDGTLEATVDTYNVAEIGSDNVFERANLTAEEHTLRVEVVGKSVTTDAFAIIKAFEYMPVSYTHLTLPTIYSV